MMTCHEAKAMLDRVPEEYLSPEARANLDAHLKQCPSCREDRALLTASWDLLDRFEAPAVSGDFTVSVMRRTGGTRRPRKVASHSRRRGVPNWGVVAAVAAVVLAAVVLWVFHKRGDKKHEEAQLPAPKPAVDVAVKPAPIEKQDLASQSPVLPKLELPSLKRRTPPVENPDLVPEREPVVVQDVPPPNRTPPAPDVPARETVRPTEAVAADERLIRDLEVYEKLDLLKNLDLLVDLDVIEKLDDSAF